MNTISLLSGFLVIFTGVYLLNLSRGDPDGHKLLNGPVSEGAPTDGLTGLQTRRSMQSRRSMDPGRLSAGSAGFGTSGERNSFLRRASEEESVGFRLGSLAEDSDEDSRQHNGSVEYDEHRPLKSNDR